MNINPGDAGVLTQITTDYMGVFAGYVTQFMAYGKELFAVLMAINLTWLFLWYAFDKDSLASSMSDFLKKFTIAMIFYGMMLAPEYMQSIIDSSTQIGLTVTGATSLDPSSIVNIGTNVSLQALKSMADLSLMFEPGQVLLRVGVFFIVLFCFMSVALQVAVTQVVATALAMLSCFTLGFSGLGATVGVARRSIDALIAISFKLLGYYVVIGASIPVFSDWNQIEADFFQNDKQSLWLCASTLMFWLLSKSLASVFERVGGGLVGETAGVDVAALAVSTGRAIGTGFSSSKPSILSSSAGHHFNPPPLLSPTTPGRSMAALPMHSSILGTASFDTARKLPVLQPSSQDSAQTASLGTHTNEGDNRSSEGYTGRPNVINFKKRVEESALQSRRTYPKMSQDGKPYKTG